MDLKKSGGWKSQYGGRDFKGSGGKVEFTGKSDGKGIPKSPLPSGGGGKKGQSFYLGQGAGRGIPSKSVPKNENLNSRKAAMRDDADA